MTPQIYRFFFPKLAPTYARTMVTAAFTHVMYPLALTLLTLATYRAIQKEVMQPHEKENQP